MKGMPAVELYSHFFILKNSAGEIYKNMPYKISDGTNTIKGRTDSKGQTQTIHTEKVQELTIKIDSEAIENYIEY